METVQAAGARDGASACRRSSSARAASLHGAGTSKMIRGGSASKRRLLEAHGRRRPKPSRAHTRLADRAHEGTTAGTETAGVTRSRVVAPVRNCKRKTQEKRTSGGARGTGLRRSAQSLQESSDGVEPLPEGLRETFDGVEPLPVRLRETFDGVEPFPVRLREMFDGVEPLPVRLPETFDGVEPLPVRLREM